MGSVTEYMGCKVELLHPILRVLEAGRENETPAARGSTPHIKGRDGARRGAVGVRSRSGGHTLSVAGAACARSSETKQRGKSGGRKTGVRLKGRGRAWCPPPPSAPEIFCVARWTAPTLRRRVP